MSSLLLLLSCYGDYRMCVVLAHPAPLPILAHVPTGTEIRKVATEMAHL